MTLSPLGATTYSPKLLQQALVRRQISQGGMDWVGHRFYGTPALPAQAAPLVDPDANSLTLSIYSEPASQLLGPPPIESQTDPRGTLVATVAMSQMTREDTGIWTYLIGSTLTGTLGQMTLVWNWTMAGVAATYTEQLQIMEQMPLYNALSESERFAVQQVQWMFGDLFDSTEGGPNLTENFQTHFTSERIAELMNIAIMKFNYTGPPPTNYGLSALNGGQPFPPQYMAIQVIGTYIEVLKHLCRSYVEIPNFAGMDVTFADRRDYLQRWQSILKDEEENYANIVKQVKRSLLSLGRGSLLVSGGIYGGNGGRNSLFIPGLSASLSRSYRFVGGAFSVNFPSVGTGR